MRPTKTRRTPSPFRLPYDLLLRANRQLVVDNIELGEEVRQLKAALDIYRDLTRKIAVASGAQARDRSSGE